MAQEQPAPSGPDLTRGVAITDLAGGRLVGHVGNEEVLLVRAGSELFAVGAHCSRYRAPLSGGLVTNATIRCPSHYASFDLRSGEAVDAPDLSPIACWKVERRGDLIFVTDERDQPKRRLAAKNVPGRIVPPELDHSLSRQAILSSTLAPIFRARFCDFALANRKPTTFSKHSVIYDMGDRERTFFFLQSGFAKVGAITTAGCEVIYDVRKEGDVVGELCASEQARPDRAVALEETSAICIPFEEVMQHVLQEPQLVVGLMDVFCRAIREAYAQVNSLAVDDTVHRLIKVLIGLATKIGRRSGALVELPTYLTQEEIAQMAGARRERVSTALNSLRRRGMVQYSARGHMVLNAAVLEAQS